MPNTEIQVTTHNTNNRLFPHGNIATVAHNRHAAFVLFPRFMSGFHRGENVSTAVETFTPRWKPLHRGGNVFIPYAPPYIAYI